MTAHNHQDENIRVFDAVRLDPTSFGEPAQGWFRVAVHQLLIPTTENGFAAMGAELEGVHFGHELIEVAPPATATRYGAATPPQN